MKKFLFSIVAISVTFLFGSFKEMAGTKSITKTANYAIFGKQNANTTVIDNSMADHVYYLVSGHGGPDPGAVAKISGKNISEDEYAYDITLRFAKNLLSHGAKVYMIVRDENDGIRDEELLDMDNDETLWGGLKIPLNQSQRLRQRTNVINSLYEENLARGYQTQRVIETHVDSRYAEHKVDIFFYYNQNKPESKRLAGKMFDTIKSKYDNKQKGRGYTGEVKARNLWMITESKPPIVFIELGNITNDFDRKRLLIPDNRQAIANWFLAGVMN